MRSNDRTLLICILGRRTARLSGGAPGGLLRQDHAELRAFAGSAIDLDHALGKLYDALDHGKPQPVPRRLVRGVALIKFFKDPRFDRLGHADPVVAHPDDHAFRLLQQRDLDVAARRAEFYGVGDQVRPDVEQQAFTAVEGDLGQLGAEADLFSTIPVPD